LGKWSKVIAVNYNALKQKSDDEVGFLLRPV